MRCVNDRRAVLILMGAFLIAAALVNPIGNFPLDDDWGVGFTTFTLVQTGTIEFTPFASATAYLQFIWGALWASVFGESFTVLRFATLTLSLGSTILAYFLLRRGGASIGIALFGAFALLFHPLFFWASFTSMTHVPFVFFSLLACTTFFKAWEREGVWLAIAFVACVASFFTRQFAILNAIAPLVVALTFRRRRIVIVYAGALAVFGMLVLTGVLVASQKELVLHRPAFDGVKLAIRALHYFFFQWQNVALFFAPVLLLRKARLSRITLAVCALIFVYASFRMTWIGSPMPYMNSGNVFTDFGLGPPTLRDVFTLRMQHPFALPFTVKVALMVLTTIGALFAVSSLPVREEDALVRFAVVYLICGTAILMFMKIHFDRYSIDTAWPMVLLVLAGPLRRPRAAVATLVVLAGFAICGTQEYLSWNRARWDAYAYLRANGVALEQMDGGYEINSLLALRAGRKDLGKAGVGVIDDRVILTFSRDVPGYRVLRAFEYRRWLGLGRGAVHVQMRLSS
jgi:4-amino-4-deoxy-L-arabinose transferase-like glycosyltransferase